MKTTILVFLRKGPLTPDTLEAKARSATEFTAAKYRKALKEMVKGGLVTASFKEMRVQE